MSGEKEPEVDYNSILPEEDDHDDHDMDPQERSAAEAFGVLGHKPEKRRVGKLPGEDMKDLNLTPMMDMMTILLVFLVQSFATDPSAIIDVNDLMKPPVSTSKTEMKPATKVIVSAEAIMVEYKDGMREVAKVAELGNLGEQISIPPVVEALNSRREHLKALENMGGVPFDGKLLIVAHDKTSFALLTSVLFCAGEAQFSEYQLVVQKKMPARPGSGSGH